MRSETGPGGHEKRSFIENARRAQIVAAAIETIAELGYAKASLARIAKRAGISKGVISYHFAGKDDLIDQIVQDAFAEAAKVRQQIQGQPTAAAKLRAFIELNLHALRDQRTYILALVEIFTNVRDAEGKVRYDFMEDAPALEMLEQVLREGQQSGEFRDFPARVMAVTVQSAVDGAVMQLAAHPDMDLDSHVRELVELFDIGTRRNNGITRTQEDMQAASVGENRPV